MGYSEREAPPQRSRTSRKDLHGSCWHTRPTSVGRLGAGQYHDGAAVGRHIVKHLSQHVVQQQAHSIVELGGSECGEPIPCATQRQASPQRVEQSGTL